VAPREEVVPMNTLLCLGLGYTARALIRRLEPGLWRVRGSSRDPQLAPGADHAERDGIPLYPFGREVRPPASMWEGVTHVLVSAGPDHHGDPVLAEGGDALRRLPDLQWVGYLSTTGVYGDHGGAWVDEDTPPVPGQPRSVRRLRAEEDWLASGLPVHVFRLAGIYGPGRSAVERLLAGRARRILAPGQVFSRIHVDDIAAVLTASIARPRPGRRYNVCDDEPAPASDVTEYAARRLGLRVPPAVPLERADLSPMGRSFYAENRRVRNARIKEELGVTLAYPTYREGIDAIVAGLRD
jgi:hypothetical protein